MSRYHSVGFAVKALSNQIKRYMLENRCELDEPQHMTGMQRAVIGYLGERPGQDIFQRDLEEAFHIRRSTATGILQLMERNSLIRREPVDYDARLKKLTLTEKGAKIRYQAHINMIQFEERLTKGIATQELDLFYRVVEQMIDNIS